MALRLRGLAHMALGQPCLAGTCSQLGHAGPAVYPDGKAGIPVNLVRWYPLLHLAVMGPAWLYAAHG